MARLTHKATDSLPEVARQIMLAGFRGKKTYAAIARELAAIGVNVPERTIARRRSDWEAEERRREALMILGQSGATRPSWDLTS
jgi:hypothetical protein